MRIHLLLRLTLMGGNIRFAWHYIEEKIQILLQANEEVCCIAIKSGRDSFQAAATTATIATATATDGVRGINLMQFRHETDIIIEEIQTNPKKKKLCNTLAILWRIRVRFDRS